MADLELSGPDLGVIRIPDDVGSIRLRVWPPLCTDHEACAGGAVFDQVLGLRTGDVLHYELPAGGLMEVTWLPPAADPL